MLLSVCGENEVCVGDGNEGALRLAPFQRSFTGEAARSNCDERLLNLIAGASGVSLGLAEAGETLLLVRLQTPAPHGINHDRPQKQDADGVPELDSAQK